MNHLIFGFKELRVNSDKMTDFLEQNLTPTCAAYTRNQIQAQFLNADVDMLSTFLDYVRFAPVLFALPLPAGASQPLIPHFAAIMLFIPLMDMKTMVMNVLTANVSAARLTQLRETLAGLGREEIQGPAKTERRFHALRYRDITFMYRDRQGRRPGPGIPRIFLPDAAAAISAGGENHRGHYARRPIFSCRRSHPQARPGTARAV